MMEGIRNQISACLDGELPSQEMQLLLRRVEQDAETRSTFARYALTGEIMRNTVAPQLVDGQFASRVRLRMSQQVGTGRDARWGSRFQRVMAGTGIAAAVALLAITSLRNALDGGPAGLSNKPDAAAISYTVPEPPDRLTSYMVRHGNEASVARQSSWTRVVAGELADQAAVRESGDVNAQAQQAVLDDQPPQEHRP